VSSPSVIRTVLVTGATGDTGRAAMRESLALGLGVRAMVHKHDARSDALKTLGAEIVLGDLLEIDTIRTACRRGRGDIPLSLQMIKAAPSRRF
jgi:uncharacterized protein YbjT (DUF2867 family)